MRKVRGEVHPADLFIKHLPSKDDPPVNLSLRLQVPQRVSGAVRNSNFVFNDIGVHDKSILPHTHKHEYVVMMFPRIKAAPPQPNSDDWVPGDMEGWGRSHEPNAWSLENRSQDDLATPTVKKQGLLKVSRGDTTSYEAAV